MPKPFWISFIKLAVAIALLAFISGPGLCTPSPDDAGQKDSKKFFLKSQPLRVEDIYKKILPLRQQTGVCREIVRKLDHQHYKDIDLNDTVSSKMFDLYLKELDPGKNYFYAKDIKEFEKFRYFLDNMYITGELDAAYLIYNRYHKRIIERLVHMIKEVEKSDFTMDFTSDEVLDTDREDDPWIRSPKQMNELWQKRLKNNVLSLKLDGKSMPEISDILSKRFRSQLNRVAQTNSEDVFRVFMNVLNQFYDPHTLYFSPRISEDFDIQMSLSLEGIGAVLQSKNEYTMVTRLVPAGPADKSKLIKPGDRIVGVAQGISGEMIDVIGWRLDDVVQLIRGPKETIVRLKIIPEEAKDDHQTKTIPITRNTVKLEEQAAQKEIVERSVNGKTYKIGLIDIPTFYIDFKGYRSRDPNYKSTTRDVKQLLRELESASVDGVIVDLRENGGGALQEANDLTGLFIKSGPTVQVREARGGIQEYGDGDGKIYYDGPLVVIVDRMSASASEIFAGAIQDYHRGIIVGSQTFGKGTVQTLDPLQHGQLKLTVAKFYRISGQSTQHKGIIPDISYPSLYDVDKIGESANENALAWDRINPAPYTPRQDNEPFIPEMKKRHNARIQHDPDFQYLLAGIGKLKEMRKDTEISLNEQKRKKEIEQSKAWRLSVENAKRVAKGLSPLDKLPEDDGPMIGEGMASDNAMNNKDDEEDPILKESENIMLDYITLMHSEHTGHQAISKRE